MPDPKGHYAALQLALDASQEDVAAAYRRLAKRLHPDVPGTGDAAAFLRLHEAYAVLNDRLARAAYDRQAAGSLRDGADGVIWPARRPGATGVGEWAAAHAGEADADPALDDEPPPPRARRWPVRPTAVATGLALLLVGGGVATGVMLNRPKPATLKPPPAAATAAPGPVAPPVEDPGPSAERTAGVPSYVAPGGGQATVWRYAAEEKHYRPIGQLPAFTPVAMLRAVPNSGMSEIRLPDRTSAYIESHRLSAGDADAARRADCIYNAGRVPANGERLDTASDEAGAAVRVSNLADLPAVFVLRHDGRVAAAVYVTPHQTAVIAGVAPGQYRGEYAIGELWSRSCGRFSAAMRAARQPADAALAGGYVVPDPAARDAPDFALAPG